MKRLEGKVALVTGAGRGIGRGIAMRFAREGASVLVNDFHNMELARRTAADIEALGEGQRAAAWECDVSDRNAVERMVAEAVRIFDKLDIAVANAAFSKRSAFLDVRWEDAMRTAEVGQFGVFHTCQFAARQMVKQGSGGKIIIISSLQGESPYPNSTPYNMAKAAVIHLAQSMAVELAPHHINVNAINPGWIDTPGERGHFTEQQIRDGAGDMPWGRLGTPDDIGAAAAFLASADADYVTGIALRVDGGLKFKQ